MSECPFCKAEVHAEASVCRGCGAEKVQGYVSQSKVKGLVAVGALIGIPVGVAVNLMSHSTPLTVVVMLGITFGPLLFVKLKTQSKVSWIRPTAR